MQVRNRIPRETTPGGHPALKKPTIPGMLRIRSFRHFLRALIPVLLLSLVLGGVVELSPLEAATKKPASTTKRTPAKKTVKRTTARKPTTAKRRTTAKKTTARRVRSSKRRVATRSARFRGQRAPTTDRYLEIQQALQGAGFLENQPSGKWDDSSVAAMKRFQEQHSIPPTGKINALSLIALGLGPKRGPAPGTNSVLETPQTPIATESNERE
jgi:hypothetical protein